MGMLEKASSGIKGLDQVIDHLRLGDNVVWQTETTTDYIKVVQPFVKKALQDGRKIVYVRFGSHEPIVQNMHEVKVYEIDPRRGFESFASEVHHVVKEEGRKVFYVFDCLTDLLKNWHSDMMIGNFFKVSCPYLYELDTVAYFAIERDAHPFSTVAGIRETTQLLLDLYKIAGNVYIHPLKVWQRYSPTMFFPHLIEGDKATSITASSQAAELFSHIQRGPDRPDYWNILFSRAKEKLTCSPEEQEDTKRQLMAMLIGEDSRIFRLCDRYFNLNDVLEMASREVGTGYLGGKTIGMLLARKILLKERPDLFTSLMEAHDSFYLGADIFYTYIVQNGWWKLRTEQKTAEGYFKLAPKLRENLLQGRFPKEIQERFIQILEYYGQSPIIVRSSSLLEDNFGNAFAGKYESVFCANQGTPEERYEAFEKALRIVYASTMSEDALAYRKNRDLSLKDEQMAILVQRVSGDQQGEYFFPHLAGVGNSSNLYVWDESIIAEAGMLRLVFGLGTRAVDRVAEDYARLVSLDQPGRMLPIYLQDLRKYSQHGADVISLSDNLLTSCDLDRLFSQDIKTDKTLFASPDLETAARLRELGRKIKEMPVVYDFSKLLKKTPFPSVMKEMLRVLSQVYQHPIDMEFTANFDQEGRFKVNVLQCRPLQTKGNVADQALPETPADENCFFSVKASFMGGSVRIPIDYVVYVRPEPYSQLPEREKYEVARQIGRINSTLKGHRVLLMGPGRWGTTTPSLGVPVRFADLCHMSVLCELSTPDAGFMPELSYGSHFFLDLVESGLFYVAVMDGEKGVAFHPEHILTRENLLDQFFPDASCLKEVILLVQTKGMEMVSDVANHCAWCS